MLDKYKISQAVIKSSSLLKPLGLIYHDFLLSKSTTKLSPESIKYSALKIYDYKEPNKSEKDNNSSISSNSKKDFIASVFSYPQTLTFAPYPLFPPQTLISTYNRLKTITTSLPSSSRSPLQLPSSPPFSSVISKEDYRNKAIKLHTGSFANQVTRSYNADAITIGRNIFFSTGKMDPFSPRGLALIAHELFHIKQQEDDTSLIQNDTISHSKRASLEKKALEKERDILEYLNNKYSMGFRQLEDSRNFPYDIGSKPLGLFPSINFMTYPYLTSDLLRFLSHSVSRSENAITRDIASKPYTNSVVPLIIKKESPLEMLPHVSVVDTNQAASNSSNVSNSPPPSPSSSIVLQNSVKASSSGLNQAGVEKLIFASSPLMQPHNTISDSTTSIPFTAESGRQLEPNATSTASPPPPPSTLPQITTLSSLIPDVNRLAEQVFELIQEKIKMQRNLTGFR